MATGLFLAEGEDIVAEGLSAAILPVETFVSSDRPPPQGLAARLARGGPLHEVTDEVMSHLSELGHPARVIAVFDSAALPDAPKAPTLSVHLDQVTDPGNVGTVIRAAAAFGAGRVSLSRGCADPYSGKAVRASMGAVFHVSLALAAALPSEGRRLALAASADTVIWDVDLTEPVTVVVGSEREGVSPQALAACDLVAAIPQTAGAESLNAAAAATIALYEASRQRAIQTESVSPAAGGRRSNQP